MQRHLSGSPHGQSSRSTTQNRPSATALLNGSSTSSHFSTSKFHFFHLQISPDVEWAHTRDASRAANPTRSFSPNVRLLSTSRAATSAGDPPPPTACCRGRRPADAFLDLGPELETTTRGWTSSRTSTASRRPAKVQSRSPKSKSHEHLSPPPWDPPLLLLHPLPAVRK